MEIALDLIVGPIYREVKGWQYYRVGIDGKIYTRYRCYYGGVGIGRKIELTNSWHECNQYKHTKEGHLNVSLWDHKRTGYSVHCLVLETFDRFAIPGEQCRHLDGNPTNNKLNNLIWGTSAENAADRIRLGTVAKGENHGRALLTEVEVKEIRRRLAMGEKQCDLAKEFKVAYQTINNIYLNKRWRKS